MRKKSRVLLLFLAVLTILPVVYAAVQFDRTFQTIEPMLNSIARLLVREQALEGIPPEDVWRPVAIVIILWTFIVASVLKHRLENLFSTRGMRVGFGIILSLLLLNSGTMQLYPLIGAFPMVLMFGIIYAVTRKFAGAGAGIMGTSGSAGKRLIGDAVGKTKEFLGRTYREWQQNRREESNIRQQYGLEEQDAVLENEKQRYLAENAALASGLATANYDAVKYGQHKAAVIRLEQICEKEILLLKQLKGEVDQQMFLEKQEEAEEMTDITEQRAVEEEEKRAVPALKRALFGNFTQQIEQETTNEIRLGNNVIDITNRIIKTKQDMQRFIRMGINLITSNINLVKEQKNLLEKEKNLLFSQLDEAKNREILLLAQQLNAFTPRLQSNAQQILRILQLEFREEKQVEAEEQQEIQTEQQELALEGQEIRQAA